MSIPLPFFAPYLDEKELSVIEAIREGRHDEIEVRLRDGSVERIELKERRKGGIRGIDDLLSKISFGEMTIKVQDGKPVLTELVEKRKV